jgi:hypothetical protein
MSSLSQVAQNACSGDFLLAVAGSVLANVSQTAGTLPMLKASLGETAAFIGIGAVVLGGGLASALVKRTFHSVMYLGLVLVGIAAYFVLIGSPLIGVIQILVYVGGILTLFIFAVMFVTGDETEDVTP